MPPYTVQLTFTISGQLTKMGIMPGSKTEQKAPANKRRSTQLDFSNLGPLKKEGTVGFSAFRDQESEALRRRKSGSKSNGRKSGGMDEDSDDDNSDASPLPKMEDNDDKFVKTHLAPEDAQAAGELQAGIDRIRVSLSEFHMYTTRSDRSR